VQAPLGLGRNQRRAASFCPHGGATFLYDGYRREWVTQRCRTRLGTGRARRRPSLQPPWVPCVVVQHDEARDTSEIRSDHAGLVGGDRNRRPTCHPALWRRACTPNGKSSTRDCPGSPDGTLSSGTAYSQADSTQSAAQGDWLLKAGIECPEFPAQSFYTTPCRHEGLPTPIRAFWRPAFSALRLCSQLRGVPKTPLHRRS
jgi:hypothetical protein